MKATWFTVGILALGPLALPATSEARTRVGIRVVFTGHNDSRYDSRDTWRLGYERGYREGASEGSRDGRRHSRYDYRRHSAYRDSDRGYRSSHGSRWRYSQGYRRGFEDGYRRGYQSRASYRHDRNDYRSDYDRYDDRESYRHRHSGRSGWCYDRHQDWNDDDWGRVIREEPPSRR